MLRRAVAKRRPVRHRHPLKRALVRNLAALLIQSNGYPPRGNLNTIAPPESQLLLA